MSSHIRAATVAGVLLWLALYVPSYLQAHGALHFLQLCNVGVLVTCFALLTRSALWLSAQWLAAPLIGVLWLADVAMTLATGRALHGGTLYLWDPSIPLAARVLSSYHLFVPLVLLWSLRRSGYDARALLVQSATAAVVIALSSIVATPQDNLNYLYHLPDGTAYGGPLWVRSACQVMLVVVLLYLPMHLLSQLMLKPAEPRTGSKRS